MAVAGYSGTPLLKKLGIQPGMKLYLVHAPKEYSGWLKFDVSRQLIAKPDVPDLVHLFAANEKIFISEMKQLLPLCRKNPKLVIWVSWYKKSAGIPTDLTEDVIRNWALKNSLVDVKVCAVSESWSGLKLVVPLSKR